MMKKIDIINIFNYRFACKHYNNTQKITEEDMQIILEAGRLSPSSFGLEPWKFMIFNSEEAKNKLSETNLYGCKTQLETCSHFLVLLAMTESLFYNKDYIKSFFKNIKQIKNESELNQMLKIIDYFTSANVNSINNWLEKQCYIALGNMMTSAAMLGIDSCAMEGFNRESLTNNLVNNFKLNSSEYLPVVLISFGYRKDNNIPIEKTRKSLTSITEVF